MSNKNFNKQTNTRKSNKDTHAKCRKDFKSKKTKGSDLVEPKLEKPMNDPRWYMINEQVGSLAGRIAYSHFTGTQFARGAMYGVGVDTSKMPNRVPGVFSISFVPGLNSSVQSTSAINVAARSIYSYVRHMNSGNRNYESPDLMMYILAMNHVYLMIAEASRAYRLAITYSAVNRYIPRLVGTAAGIDLTDITADPAAYLSALNVLISKTRSLFVPEELDYVRRQAMLLSNVWTDADDLRGQIYVFKPEGYFKYSGFTAETGTELIWNKYDHNSVRTGAEVLRNINDCLETLLQDEDANIMSGDILKAYGDKCYKLAMVKEMEEQPFAYDLDVLTQIQNSFAAGRGDSYVHFGNITQKDGYVVYDPYWSVPADSTRWRTSVGLQIGKANAARFFNANKKDPDWKDTFEYTALAICTDKNNAAADGHLPIYSSGVIPVGYRIWTLDPNHTSGYHPFGYDLINCVIINTTDLQLGSIDNVQAMAIASWFKYHPILYPFMAPVNLNADAVPTIPMFEGETYTFVESRFLKSIHDVASMGLLATDVLKRD